jgi:hypothetical protein
MIQGTIAQRHLTWEGCLNVRDLGGLPTADGRTTAWKSIIRADLLSSLTAAGLSSAEIAGLRGRLR